MMTVKKKRLSFSLSFAAITVALSVVNMFISIIPGFFYIAPALSGFFMYVICDELGKKWALLSYLACSFIVLLIIPNIESVIFFIMFFGYYPTVRGWIEKPGFPAFLKWVFKLGVFNLSMLIIYQLFTHVFKINDMLDGLSGFGERAVFVLWAVAVIAFVVYDISIDSIILAYRKAIKPRL